ncbi:unnamed protein product [Cochlearia groenlandica]
MKKCMEDGFEKLNDKIDVSLDIIGTRLKSLEDFVFKKNKGPINPNQVRHNDDDANDGRSGGDFSGGQEHGSSSVCGVPGGQDHDEVTTTLLEVLATNYVEKDNVEEEKGDEKYSEEEGKDGEEEKDGEVEKDGDEENVNVDERKMEKVGDNAAVATIEETLDEEQNVGDNAANVRMIGVVPSRKNPPRNTKPSKYLGPPFTVEKKCKRNE